MLCYLKAAISSLQNGWFLNNSCLVDTHEAKRFSYKHNGSRLKTMSRHDDSKTRNIFKLGNASCLQSKLNMMR